MGAHGMQPVVARRAGDRGTYRHREYHRNHNGNGNGNEQRHRYRGRSQMSYHSHSQHRRQRDRHFDGEQERERRWSTAERRQKHDDPFYDSPPALRRDDLNGHFHAHSERRSAAKPNKAGHKGGGVKYAKSARSGNRNRGGNGSARSSSSYHHVPTERDRDRVPHHQRYDRYRNRDDHGHKMKGGPGGAATIAPRHSAKRNHHKNGYGATSSSSTATKQYAYSRKVRR